MKDARDRNAVASSIKRLTTMLAVILTCATLTAAQDREETWKAYIQQATQALKTGRYALSEQLFRAAISEVGKLNQGDERSVDLMIVSLDGLGAALRYQRKFAEAERSSRKLVRLIEVARSEDDPEYAIALSNLGLVLSELKKYKESETIHRRALALREQYQGKQHPDVAISLLNLGKLRYEQRDKVEAEALFKRALSILNDLAIEQRTSDHVNTMLMCVNNLALIYMARKEYVAAERLYQSTIDAVATKEAEHSELKKYLLNYGALLRLLNRPAEAQKLETRARLLKGPPSRSRRGTH